MPERTHDDNRGETRCVAPASPPRRSKRHSNENYRSTPRDNLTARKTSRPVAVVAPKHGPKGVYAAGSPLNQVVGSCRSPRMARHQETPCPPRSISFALAKCPTMPRLLAASAQGACYLLLLYSSSQTANRLPRPASLSMQLPLQFRSARSLALGH